MTMDSRALIVEDDQSWQDILKEILVDAGMDVDIASSYLKSSQIIKDNVHRIAIVDLSLAGSDHHNIDGMAVLDSIQQHDPGCVSILLTGYATVDLAVRAITENGAFSCLQKENFKRAQFRDLVTRALVVKPPYFRERPPSGDEPINPIPQLLEVTSTNQVISDDGLKIYNKNNRLILVVDDDAGWRSILNDIIFESGFSLFSCGSFGEALGLLRREKFSLAVIDLSLKNPLPITKMVLNDPENHLDGYRLLASARAAKIPTIVVSGVVDTKDIENAYNEYAIFAFFQKQVFDRYAFKNAIKEAIYSPINGDELATLTDREREVLDLLGQGLTNKEIAENLVISTNTVKRHIKSIFSKLNIHTRSAAAAKVVALTE